MSETERDEKEVEREENTPFEVTAPVAEGYLSECKRRAKEKAISVFLRVLSFLSLLLFFVLATVKKGEILPIAAALLLMVALLIGGGRFADRSRRQSPRFAPIGKKDCTVVPTAFTLIEEKKELFRPVYRRLNGIGVCFALSSPVPVAIGIFCKEKTAVLLLPCLAVLLLGVAASFLTAADAQWEGFRILSDGSAAAFQRSKIKSFAAKSSFGYWIAVIFLYVLFVLGAEEWQKGWVIWVAALLIYPFFAAVFGHFSGKKSQ